MSIPFIRQLPERRVLQQIDCAPEIELVGREFIANGGRYLIEVLPKLSGPNVRVVACLLSPEGQQLDVVEETVENGPELVNAVNRVIVQSVKHLHAGETKH